jgi:hypothetical protein
MQYHQSVLGVHYSLDLKGQALSFKHHTISLHLKEAKLLQKAKEAIAKICSAYCRVDVIKIHFITSPIQLLLWKAVDFSCLLQFRFIECLSLSISCLSDILAD